MNYAPAIASVPSNTTPQRVLNGDPARARDALELDRLVTAIAVARPLQPMIIGMRLVSGTTYTFATLIPPYTTHVAFGILSTGTGTVAISTADDAYNAEAAVAGGGSSLDQATWTWLIDERVVSADGTARALEVTDRAEPYVHTFEIDITDADATNIVRVWAVQVRPLPRRSTLALI